jgi:hypothetical protein
MTCQRWRNHRTSYRPAGEPIDPSQYGVEPIEREVAKRFVETHHYSRTFPAARFCAGLFHRRTLAGVAVFSVPMNQAVVPKYCGVRPNDGAELGRFVLLDSVPANGETWFLSRAFRTLPKTILGVVSYSDPMPRSSVAGQIVKPGHVGVIYQAANAAYFGQSCKRTILLASNGEVISERALSKLRNGERGREYVREMLSGLGAKQLVGESDEAFVVRLLKSDMFRRVRHPGNHTYAWSLHKRITITSDLSYPKLAACLSSALRYA